MLGSLDGEKPPSSREPTFTEGWQSHALGQALPVSASTEFMLGWLERHGEGRPTLVYAAPGQDPASLANLADRIDL